MIYVPYLKKNIAKKIVLLLRRPFLKEIKNSSETHIMLHCSPESIVHILGKAKEVDLVGPYQNFFLTSLVSHILFAQK